MERAKRLLVSSSVNAAREQLPRFGGLDMEVFVRSMLVAPCLLSIVLSGCGSAQPGRAPMPSVARIAMTEVPPPPVSRPSFHVYQLALSWARQFCHTHHGDPECAAIAGRYGETHLTLHGLWPGYTDQERPGPDVFWPDYCPPCSKDSADRYCNADPSKLPPEMKQYAPGYTDGSLADHEWRRHGSCTGFDQDTYFALQMATMARAPGDHGTPAIVSQTAGGDVALADLQSAYGGADVLASCDGACNLSGVVLCFDVDPSGRPGAPAPCPEWSHRSKADNSCAIGGRCPVIHLL